jgi:hypothetical protein
MANTRPNIPKNQPITPPSSSPKPPASTPAKLDVDQSSPPQTDTLPELIEASVKGEDEPMERDHPRAPGALIWLSYPLALLLLLALAVWAFMFMF